VRQIPLRLRDVAAIDTGHRLPFVIEPVVAVDAHQHKRRDDQQEHQEHQDLGVLADEINRTCANSQMRLARAKKTKGEHRVRLCLGGGC
jgi:hypothetical protein